ncbi:MAG: hypothetical protein WCC99_12525 [Candidatus Sulfotelmatobacter sp.]
MAKAVSMGAQQNLRVENGRKTPLGDKEGGEGHLNHLFDLYI